jgi:exodeoxyribonuclease-5
MLSKEQKNVVTNIIKTIPNQQITKLSGFAGTGKTTIVKFLSDFFPNFAVCSYTGKAVSVLKKKGILEPSTIHSLIYKPEVDAFGNIILDSNGDPTFVLAPSLQCSGILVDEGSMISEEIYNDLKSFNLPIIFTGDSGQLPPIGDDINLMKNPDFTLETIHRNAGEIAYFAEYIRKGYRPSSFNGSSKVKFISKSDADNYLLEVDQVICAYNRTRVEINNRIRELKGIKSIKPVEKEKIICLRNNKKLFIFNGLQGIIKKLYLKPKNKMRFSPEEFPDVDLFFDPSQFGKEKYDFGFSKDEPNPFDFAYCLTTHKCQGSEFDKVMVFEQRCDLWEHKRWTYTAASRAKEKLIWVS